MKSPTVTLRDVLGVQVRQARICSRLMVQAIREGRTSDAAIFGVRKNAYLDSARFVAAHFAGYSMIQRRWRFPKGGAR